jgi:4-hydroxy-3-polyprenylbenzoate decarboxylase
MLIAITGASGIDLAVKLLEKLQNNGIKTELIISKLAQQLIKIESSYDRSYIEQLANKVHNVDDLTAEPSSGSYFIDTMVIIPCSMKTLAAIANGYADNLIARAADVMIKEKRKLILVVRESPFSAIHLENMLKLARIGAIIAPPMPSYYFKPKSIEELNDHIIGRLMDHLGIESDIKRWGKI